MMEAPDKNGADAGGYQDAKSADVATKSEPVDISTALSEVDVIIDELRGDAPDAVALAQRLEVAASLLRNGLANYKVAIIEGQIDSIPEPSEELVRAVVGPVFQNQIAESLLTKMNLHAMVTDFVDKNIDTLAPGAKNLNHDKVTKAVVEALEPQIPKIAGEVAVTVVTDSVPTTKKAFKEEVEKMRKEGQTALDSVQVLTNIKGDLKKSAQGALVEEGTKACQRAVAKLVADALKETKPEDLAALAGTMFSFGGFSKPKRNPNVLRKC